jgi:cytochrome P450
MLTLPSVRTRIEFVQAPAAERPFDVRRIAGEVRRELRRGEELPPGNLRFSFRETRRFQRDPLGTGLEYHARYGRIFTQRTLHRPIVVMLGPEANHFVTVSGAEHFSWREGMFGEMLSPLIGAGLITSDGPYHDRARRIAMPAFHRSRMDAAVAVMVEETERALAGWRPGDVVDVYAWIRDLAMSIAMRALVGIDPRSGDGPRQAEIFERALSYLYAPLWTMPLRGPGTPWARLKANRRKLDAFVLAEVARRRREPAGDDILSMLIEARDEDTGQGFADEELMDQVLTMLFGGHDTSSSTLSFLLYELARHPAVGDRVAAEAGAVLADSAPSVDQLMGELPELGMAFDETLRMYPPVWFGPRKAVSEFEFGGHRVPAGTHVMYSSLVSHRLPDVFENPDAFVPERFAPAARKLLPKGAYIPFGGGQRICIGKRFGQLVVKTVAATVLRRFRLDLEPGFELRIEKTPTLSPYPGLPMRVR